MKSKEQIKSVIKTEKENLDNPNHPMDTMEWANNQGWIEALEWVLGRYLVDGEYVSDEEFHESNK